MFEVGSEVLSGRSPAQGGLQTQIHKVPNAKGCHIDGLPPAKQNGIKSMGAMKIGLPSGGT